MTLIWRRYVNIKYIDQKTLLTMTGLWMTYGSWITYVDLRLLRLDIHRLLVSGVWLTCQ